MSLSGVMGLMVARRGKVSPSSVCGCCVYLSLLSVHLCICVGACMFMCECVYDAFESPVVPSRGDPDLKHAGVRVLCCVVCMCVYVCVSSSV